MGSPYGQQPPGAANCANCGAQLDPSQRFCPACGQANTGAAWQPAPGLGAPTYQAGTSGVQAGGPMVPPAAPGGYAGAPGAPGAPMAAPGAYGAFGAAPSSPMNAGYGQPPTYPPTVGATPQPGMPQPGVSNPNGQPYNWTNPLQPPYAAGQQPPYGQAGPVTGGPFAPGQTTYQTPGGYAGPLSTPMQPGMPGMVGAPGQYAPTYQSPVPPAPQRRPRGRLVAIISAICIIAVLGAGGVLAYNFLASHTENQAAKIVPSDTYAYYSIDLVSLANNSHNVSLNNLLNPAGTSNGSASDPFHSIGLSFQTDVQPWLGRDVALAVFPKAGGSTQVASPLGQYGGAFLIQSKDDNAAQAAMTKVANYLRGNGATITNTTYSGVTLYSAQQGDAAYNPAITFGAGKGWAILGYDMASAQAVIDRIDGKGASLADSSAFQSATSDLPSDRFATMYLNLRAIVSAVSPGSNASIPFINTYPIAVGYTEWTNAGVRAAITFKGNANIGNVAGDTKSLAALVPSGALGYVGIANISGLYQAGSQLVGTTSDPTQSEFGISSTDSALQQPAAFAVLGANGGESQALYLKLTSNSEGQTLIQKIADGHSWTTQTTTIAGQSVTEFSDDNPGSFLGNDYGYDYSSYGPYVAGYAAVVNNTLILTGKDTAMQSIIQTAQGGPSLAQDSSFSQLAGAAPSGAAITGYVNYASLTPGTGSSSLISRMPALMLTGVWNNSEMQITLDSKIN